MIGCNCILKHSAKKPKYGVSGFVFTVNDFSMGRDNYWTSSTPNKNDNETLFGPPIQYSISWLSVSCLAILCRKFYLTPPTNLHLLCGFLIYLPSHSHCRQFIQFWTVTITRHSCPSGYLLQWRRILTLGDSCNIIEISSSWYFDIPSCVESCWFGARVGFLIA